MHRLQVQGGAPALTEPGRPDIPEDPDIPEGTGIPEDTGPAPRSTGGPFLVTAGVVALDQATKAWAVAALSDGPVRLIGDTLALRLVRNPGGAFSLLTGFTPFLAVLAIALVAVIIRITRRTADRVTAYTLAVILGGAVGNLVDRLVRSPGFLRGHVVDFIDLSFWPTFNLADSAISVGVVIVLLRGWRT